MTSAGGQLRGRTWAGVLLGLVLLVVGIMGGCKRAKETAEAPAETRPAVFVAVEPAAKPTGTLAADATCVTPECHAKFKTAAHIHGPVSEGSCKSCHEPDQGGHIFPLIRTGNATCTFCHTVSGTQMHQHKALEQTAAVEGKPGAVGGGGCLTCHDPHISKAKFMLTADNVEAVCAKCHTLPLKKHAHEPFAQGQCTVCHQPHQSQFASLLRSGEGPEHCFSCHTDKKKAMAEAPHVHKVSAQSCTTCHGPHATDNPKQLKRSTNDTCLSCHTQVKQQLASAKHVHGAVIDNGQGCAACHDPHASAQPAELKARTDKVCLTCHEKAVKTADGRTIAAMGGVLASKNLHGPVKAGECSDCHLPHAADQPNLLTKYFPDSFYASFDVNNYALCFSCHDQQVVLQARTTSLTNFRDGDRNLHYVHVNRADKGRTCKTCHEIHGSDLPNHMAASVPFEGSTWAMPMNYEPAKDGGSCTPGCHEKKTYDRNKPATPPPNPPTTADRGAP